MPRLHRRAVAGALAAAMSLPACAAGTEVDPDGEVRIAIVEPERLLPADTHDPTGLQLLSALFAPLVDFDPAGRPYEVAAESIEPDQRARVWTIALREGMTFHNGEPVTADSYLGAWNFAAHAANEQRGSYLFARIAGYERVNPPGPSEPTAERLSGLTKVDSHTFTVELSEPFREFRSMLGYPAFYPLPAAAFTPAGDLVAGFARAPVGNGPFRLTGWEPGRITVQRYEQYAGPPARAGTVEFVGYEDLRDAYDDLLSGRVDVLGDIPAQRLPAAADDLGRRYLPHPAPGFQFLAFPAYQRELADPEVRRAISMAIDRDRLLGDARAVARSFTGPAVPGAREDTCGEACVFDPAGARDLYARAGGPALLRITYNDDGGHSDWIERVCGQLRDHLEVRCTASAEPTLTDVLARVGAQDEVGIFRLGWVTDYPTLESYLRPLYSTGGSSNWHGYSNLEFDALVAAGQVAGSLDEAVAAYHAAEDMLARDLPVIPLSFDKHHIGHSDRVQNVTVTWFGVDLTQLEPLGRS